MERQSHSAASEVKLVLQHVRPVSVLPNRVCFGRAFLATALALMLLTLVLGAGGSAAAASPTLTAYFAADGTISVTLADGTPVGTPTPPGTLIPPGTYQVVIDNDYRDDADIVHMFDLSGPGVNLVTDMNEGEEVQGAWSETFQPNSTYTWQDDYRPTTIHAVFRTSATAAATTTSTSTAATTTPSGSTSPVKSTSNTPSGTKISAVGTAIKPDPFRGTLAGAVSAAGALTLTNKGKAVSTLKSGRYTIDVSDRAKKRGFTIQGLRKLPVAVSGTSFVGKHSVTLDLTPGQWLYYSTAAGKKNYFIVVG